LLQEKVYQVFENRHREKAGMERKIYCASTSAPYLAKTLNSGLSYQGNTGENEPKMGRRAPND
jgi:hypothetical protein